MNLTIIWGVNLTQTTDLSVIRPHYFIIRSFNSIKSKIQCQSKVGNNLRNHRQTREVYLVSSKDPQESANWYNLQSRLAVTRNQIHFLLIIQQILVIVRLFLNLIMLSSMELDLIWYPFQFNKMPP